MARAQNLIRRGTRFGGQLLDTSVVLSKREALERGRRWRSRGVLIGQGAAAAAVAYSLARYVFAVPVPLFAPVAAILCLGMTYGQRFKRALEVTIGVGVGALCGELFVNYFGMGVWQVVAIVAVGMSVASLLGAGTLMVTQAAVQGLIVALLAGHTTTAFGRWFEALIGCVTALVFASVVPSSALLRPQTTAADVMERLSGLLVATATGLRDLNRPQVEEALTMARSTEEDLDELREHLSDTTELTTYLPWYRERGRQIKAISGLLEPMDRAVRNARVLIRRAAVSLQTGEPVPESYIHQVWDLADATDAMTHHVATGATDPALDELLLSIAADTARPAPGVELSAEVIRAQVRSILVDYFMMLGRSLDEAQTAVQTARPSSE